jgi:elongation factor 1-beta
VDLVDQIKMAKAIVTVKIMPESPEMDLNKIEELAKEKIEAFAGKGETKTEIEPIAFGLRALKIIFVMDEKIGSPDPVAEEISRMEGVNSAEISDVRRAIG